MAFYIQGQSLIEMAEQLDTPLGTIKRRLHTARKRLKVELQAHAVDAEEWADAFEGELDVEDGDEQELVAAGSGRPARW